jgi:hypothetical protein
MNPTCGGIAPLLRPIYRTHNPNRHLRPLIAASNNNNGGHGHEHEQEHEALADLELLCLPPRLQNTLHRKQHDPQHPFGCGIFKRVRSKEQDRRTLFMSSKSKNGQQQHNGDIINISTILCMVADAEMGALFSNAKEGVHIRNILEEIIHPQPATPLQTDNMTSHKILRSTCKKQRSKAIDMSFYWVRDRSVQNQFNIGWGPSAQNLGNYFTKHHTPAHHKGIRKMYIHDYASPKYIPSAHAKPPQGCVDITISPRAPAGHHANTSMAGAHITAINWQCLVQTLFCAPKHYFLSSHKSS